MTSSALMITTHPDGHVTLKGWIETPNGRTEHWPTFTLCQSRADLPERLAELGLALAAGHDLTDLDQQWDVYLHHADPTQLRAHLDSAAA
jgi:hypothetical protein